MSQGFDTVIFEKHGAVASVTLNRPAQINAYNIQMRDDLWEVFSAIEMDREIKAVVIRGAGERGFCAGADLSEFGTAPSTAVARMVRWERDLFGLLARLPAATIAALHGHVIGSGIEIALLCDMRIAAQDVRFAMPETGLGLVPAATGTQSLPRVLRPGRALDLLLTGREADAAEALRTGLVQRVVDPADLTAAAFGLARQIAQVSGDGAIRAREAVRAAGDLALADGLAAEARIAAALAAGAQR